MTSENGQDLLTYLWPGFVAVVVEIVFCNISFNHLISFGYLAFKRLKFTFAKKAEDMTED